MLPDAGRTVPRLGHRATRERAAVLSIRWTDGPGGLDVGGRHSAAGLDVAVKVLLGAVAPGAELAFELPALQSVEPGLMRRQPILVLATEEIKKYFCQNALAYFCLRPSAKDQGIT